MVASSIRTVTRPYTGNTACSPHVGAGEGHGSVLRVLSARAPSVRKDRTLIGHRTRRRHEEAPVETHGPETVPTWDEIVERHSDRVYRLAYRLTGNRHDAEDLTQEVFVRVFRSLSSYTPGTFEGWLHRITTNLFLDSVRRKAKIRFEGLADDAADRLAGREPTPAQ